MHIKETGLAGLLLIEPQCFCDERGFFLESFHPERYRVHGITDKFVQDNHKDRPGHDRRYAICADKLASELGFRAGTTLTDGLRRTIDWYLSNEPWWRAVQTGAYRDWMKLQYGAALTGSVA